MPRDVAHPRLTGVTITDNDLTCMPALPNQANAVASYASEMAPRAQRAERDDRIFKALPLLGSAAYLSLLKTATAAELPAPVLVRAYRALGRESDGGRATLDRLVGRHNEYGYLRALYTSAERRRSRLGGYGPGDLVQNAIGEIVATLGGPQGEGADTGWVHYLHQCMESAYRKLVGRRAQRAGESGGDLDQLDDAHSVDIPWQGSVAPSNLEWVEEFLHRAALAMPTETLRLIALDVISHSPTKTSSGDSSDTMTLAERFKVRRQTIYKWQRQVRALLRAALENQNEREIDLSYLSRFSSAS
jgi:hypothetical protein